MKTIVNFILDKSGSMASIEKDVIGGFNSYIKELKEGKNSKDILFTLTLFDTVSIDTPYLLTPIKDVQPLNSKTYRPNGGTPLYDAAVETIENIADRVDEMKGRKAVVVTIMTDGEENSSVKHDQDCLKDLIEKLEKRGNWTFTFMGANQDAWNTANKFGIAAGNTMSWEASSLGSTNALRSLAQNTVMYAMSAGGGGAGGTKAFFSGSSDMNKDSNDAS